MSDPIPNLHPDKPVLHAAQENTATPRAESSRVAPARTREEIIASEKQGTLREYLQRSIEQAARIYEASGLLTWAVAARQLETQMVRFSPAQLAWMEDRRQAGEIIFPLPGAGVQRRTMHEAAQKLKPQFTKNNERQTANDPYFWDYFENLMKSGDSTLVAGIPNQSYFAVLQPSEKPTEGSTNKSLSQQLAWLDQQKRTRAHNDVIIDASLPAEFMALQAMWTAKGGEPLDANTYTRFITIPKSPDDGVLNADWDGGRLGFNWGNVVAYACVGVRVLGRVAPQN